MSQNSVVRFAYFVPLIVLMAACSAESPPEIAAADAVVRTEARPEIYAEFALTADLSGFTDNQREMIGLLIEASQIMDDLFWRQAFGDGYQAWLASIGIAEQRNFAEMNYGPWDRLDGDKPFIDGFDAKPLGANLYPADITKEEFDLAYLPGKAGLYSVIRRNAAGELTVVPYHVEYAQELKSASELLHRAADLAENQNFANYLKLRANAFLSSEYQLSDLFWMDVKDNPIDVVIGPIETYEDKIYGYRTAFESYVLIKDMEWSERLSRFATFLPELQAGLPVPDAYKQESPGTDSDLNAYDVVYYAGDSNAGAKTIAINLPNDEEVQLAKGTRRLQLKNAMQAKFEMILDPIAGVLIDDAQLHHVTFDAFFANTMFHEVAHGLGVKNTISGGQTVREALLDLASSVEEGKADILGLYMVTELNDAGEFGEQDLMDNYVTFMAGIFRSIRFGASDAHGKANMVRFNFFAEQGAFVRDAESGKYSVDFDRMQAAMIELSRLLLTLQGDGNYAATAELLNTRGVIGAELQVDLNRLTDASIPVDIKFNQGLAELGLE